MNDQDQAENEANLVEAARVASLLAQEAQDIQDDEEELEQEFATEEEAAGEDLSEEEYAKEMKNKMAALFEIDQDEEEPMSELDVLSLEEAAVYLKVNYSDVRQMVKEQGLIGRKIGSEWRFLRGAIADWLRAPAGVSAAPAAQPAARVERPAREEQRPQREERPRRRFPEEMSDGGESDQEQSRPPRPRPQFRSQGQFGAAPAGGPPASGGQGGYPPPRRGRYADQQQQQPPQGEYQPPPRKRPFQGQAGGNAGGPPSGGRRFAGGQGGAGQGGAGQGGAPQGSAGRFSSGPKAPKREPLGNQRFKRLDRRRFGGDQGE